jgi:hypothetical protein
MWRVVKSLIATLSLAAVGVFVVGRFSDGPLGFFSGGAFQSGEAATYPADWDFLDHEETIELQLIDPARARTVWVLVEDGEAFIPCGAPNFRLWKQWPHDAVADGRALIRSRDTVYPVELMRERDPARVTSLTRQIARKYGVDPGDSPGEDDLWIFRVSPRR